MDMPVEYRMPMSGPDIQTQDIELVTQALKSKTLSIGPFLEAFERLEKRADTDGFALERLRHQLDILRLNIRTRHRHAIFDRHIHQSRFGHGDSIPFGCVSRISSGGNIDPTRIGASPGSTARQRRIVGSPRMRRRQLRPGTMEASGGSVNLTYRLGAVGSRPAVLGNVED